ncbi:MAG TPA: FAD binding domain-containing protein [Gemmataceae bacterium]|nr:FAD binding domain-containing protein [Gemmataceae bacterium]
MKNFTYYRPTSVEQAVGLLEPRFGNTELLGGGTDLHALQKTYVAQPARVVSLGGIKGFGGIEDVNAAGGRYFRIGAGTSIADIAAHAGLRQNFPALTATANEIAGPQIRNMATLGGNLCQRNRCWYFRDEHVNCRLKSAGAPCFAIDGENQYHAVFTQGHPCVIASPSTLAPALIALGATAYIVGPNNARRTLDMANFYHAPANANDREHVLAANEILEHVRIPVNSMANASYEVRQKLAIDWPLVQCAVAWRTNGGKTVDAKVVLSQVAPLPHISAAAAKALNGQAINEETATAVGRAATDGARPLSRSGYKVKLVEIAVKRAVMIAGNLKRYWEV